MEKLRFVFIGGNSIFSMIPLKALVNRHELVGIVESAPRSFNPRTANIKEKTLKILKLLLKSHQLRYFALRKKVKYFFHDRYNNDTLTEFLRNIKPDIICVASMSQLLPFDVLNLPKHGVINLHPSLLPNYRGPNPWFWQIYMMEHYGGMTVHYLDESADTGNIIKQDKFLIRSGISSQELISSTISIGARLMVEAMDDISKGIVQATPQRHLDSVVRARNVKEDEQLIDWKNWNIERTWHVIRGTNQWLCCLPRPRFYPGFYWQIGNYEKIECTTKFPGTVNLDRRGLFAAHHEGKIRIYPKFSFKGLVQYFIQKI